MFLLEALRCLDGREQYTNSVPQLSRCGTEFNAIDADKRYELFAANRKIVVANQNAGMKVRRAMMRRPAAGVLASARAIAQALYATVASSTRVVPAVRTAP